MRTKRQRHPCEKWGSHPTVNKLVFLSVRDALFAPAHPDSKRQERRKRRDLERYGARLLKLDHVISCPAKKISKKKVFANMENRMREERVRIAREASARLMGKTAFFALPKPPVDALELLSHIQQLAENVMTGGIQ